MSGNNNYEQLLDVIVTQADKTKKKFEGLKKVSIPGNGDCCPVSLITSMLVEGVLSQNLEAKNRVAKFLGEDIFFEENDRKPKLKNFLQEYQKITSLKQIQDFFGSIKNISTIKEIQYMADQIREKLRKDLEDKLKSDPTLDLKNFQLDGEQGEKVSEYDKDPISFGKGIWISPDMCVDLLAQHGFCINAIDASEKLNITHLNKSSVVTNPIVLNILYSNDNHYDALIYNEAYEAKIKALSNTEAVKRSSVLSPPASATLSLASPAKPLSKPEMIPLAKDKIVSFDLPDSDQEDDYHDAPAITPLAKDKHDSTLFKHADFKKYLLNVYSAEAESSEKYSVKGDADDVDIYLADEIIATVAEDRKHKDNIKLNIVPGKEADGAYVALSSFKGFIEDNGQDLQKYNAHFTGYDTPENAKDFLESLYRVFTENDVFTCDLAITFDPVSEECIEQLLQQSAIQEFNDPALELKWRALRNHFGIEELEPQEDDNRIETEDYDPKIILPVEDDDQDSFATDPELNYQGDLDEDDISVDLKADNLQVTPKQASTPKQPASERPASRGLWGGIKNMLGFGSQQIHVPESDAEHDATLNASMDKVEADAAAEKRKVLLDQIKNHKPNTPKSPTR